MYIMYNRSLQANKSFTKRMVAGTLSISILKSFKIYSMHLSCGRNSQKFKSITHPTKFKSKAMGNDGGGS